MKSNFHDLRITQLGNRSALACLSLALQTFGKDSPQFQVVRDFMKEKRSGYVATIRNCVAGFIVCDNRDKDVEHILALAVRQSARREGIGGQLLNRVVRLPRKEIIATVDERNLDTQLFLRSQGFRAVAIEQGTPDYYVFKRSNVGVASLVTETPQAAGVYS
jgi:ribosomal protein S18 acetylase RimI-like enzyme